MKKINFYKTLYAALDSFYGWVDQGSEYDIAIEQSVYYDYPKLPKLYGILPLQPGMLAVTDR